MYPVTKTDSLVAALIPEASIPGVQDRIVSPPCFWKYHREILAFLGNFDEVHRVMIVMAQTSATLFSTSLPHLDSAGFGLITIGIESPHSFSFIGVERSRH